MEERARPGRGAQSRRALDAAACRLGGAAAARRQARRPGARGAAAEAQRGGRVHARRLGLPRRRRRPRGRRRARPATAPAPCASWTRRRGSSCRADEELVLVLALDHAGGRLDAASTPGSSSPSPPPTRRRSPTGSRPPTRAGSSPRAALEAAGGGRDRPRLPDPQPARLAAALPHLRRGARRLPRAARSSRSCRR